MTCCVPRGLPSAAPVGWVVAVLAGRDAGGHDSRVVGETVALLAPQAPVVIVSTDAEPGPLQGYGVPVVASECSGAAGMLLAALDWTSKNAWERPWVATVPAGWDRVPPDLFTRLAGVIGGSGAQAGCIAEGGQLVLDLGLWPVRLRQALRRVVAASREAGRDAHITDWAREFAIAVTDLATLWPSAQCALRPAAPPAQPT